MRNAVRKSGVDQCSMIRSNCCEMPAIEGADFIVRSLEACMGLDGNRDTACLTFEEGPLGRGYQRGRAASNVLNE